MRYYTVSAIVVLMLVAVWGAGCGGEPPTVVPDDELSVAGDQSAELREKKEATMTPSPEPTEVKPPPEAEEAVRLAREDLAERLSLVSEEIRLVSVKAMEWSDASLGCPQPGMMYAQVITPGFLVVLEAGGQQYEYHTDEGRFAVLCEE
jgi:predicted small lipoprotein YifL